VNAPGSLIVKTEPFGEQTNFTLVDKIIDIITFEESLGDAATSVGVNSKYFISEAPDSMSMFVDWGIGILTGQITYVIILSQGKMFGNF